MLLAVAHVISLRCHRFLNVVILAGAGIEPASVAYQSHHSTIELPGIYGTGEGLMPSCPKGTRCDFSGSEYATRPHLHHWATKPMTHSASQRRVKDFPLCILVIFHPAFAPDLQTFLIANLVSAANTGTIFVVFASAGCAI